MSHRVKKSLAMGDPIDPPDGGDDFFDEDDPMWVPDPFTPNPGG